MILRLITLYCHEKLKFRSGNKKLLRNIERKKWQFYFYSDVIDPLSDNKWLLELSLSQGHYQGGILNISIYVQNF